MLIIIDSMLKWVKGLNIRKSRVQNSYITTNWGGGGGGGEKKRVKIPFQYYETHQKYIIHERKSSIERNLHHNTHTQYWDIHFSWGIIMQQQDHQKN